MVRAVDGERRAALEDLLAAERNHDAADDHRDPGPFRRYPRAAFLYRRGDVLLTLDDRPQALTAFRESLAVRPPNHHIALVLTHARLAETLLALGDVGAALNECQQALVHYPLTASRRTTTALTAIRRSLAPYRRHPQARELRDHIADLTQRTRAD
jgi:tetratricopeptide (TPR) repeat protein